MELSTITSVNLRDCWQNEASDFTPWLSKEENIALLANAIGFDSLLVKGTEQPVGPFRADILCEDPATENLVLIENQLERTDHTHLGQIMTYASGLDAVTIIWIAAEFTEEHRATIDWLNRITGNDFNFFGIEIKVIRIDDSKAAPLFNVVAKPNGWTKNVRTASNGVKERRPNLNFKEMGIPLNAVLTFVDDPSKTVKVVAERLVLLDNEQVSLTRATKNLLNIETAVGPCPHWRYNGELLSDIYDKTYPFDE